MMLPLIMGQAAEIQSEALSLDGLSRRFRCVVCGVRFKERSHVKQHLDTCVSSILPEPDDGENMGITIRRRRKPCPKRGLCGLCGRNFTDLMGHQRVHTGERPHQCKVCRQRFRNSRNLKVHMAVHDTQRRFVCSVEGCNKSYKHAKLHRDHMRTHLVTGNGTKKPFQCSNCTAQFYYQSGLSTHVRSHSSSERIQRPHTCVACNRSFTQRGTLRRHFVDQHVPKGWDWNEARPGKPIQRSKSRSSSSSSRSSSSRSRSRRSRTTETSRFCTRTSRPREMARRRRRRRKPTPASGLAVGAKAPGHVASVHLATTAALKKKPKNTRKTRKQKSQRPHAKQQKNI
uniref:C2H2-type domain-containing protein n=1 Tax=Lotharella oceanica TaxID=641309 RepID=A0A7S2TJB5_9EUKA